MTTKAKVTTADVMKALQAKYSGATESRWTGGLYLEECGINGGHPAPTRCDALYAGFTSASGRTLIGHEVKVSRSDWQAELRKLGKADFWFDNTHQWYVVAPPDIVRMAELPDDWGLMLLQGSQLRIVKRAPYREVQPEWQAVRSILSRMETLRAKAYSEGARANTDRHYAEMERLRIEMRATSPLTRMPDEQYKIFTNMMTEVRTTLQKNSVFDAVNMGDVIQALVDITKVKNATHQLRHTLELRLREVERVSRMVADGLRTSYGPLEKIMKEMDDAE